MKERITEKEIREFIARQLKDEALQLSMSGALKKMPATAALAASLVLKIMAERIRQQRGINVPE